MILMTFFKLFSSESAVTTSDIQLHSMVKIYGKQAPWPLIMFFLFLNPWKEAETLK